MADTETYDLVMALECIHDMPDPVPVLATMRRLAGADGTVIVMDENVGEVFTGDLVEVKIRRLVGRQTRSYSGSMKAQ